MPEGAQLAVGSESPERLTLEDAVLGEVVQDTRFEAEEAAVDPALDLRFLVEAAHQSLVVQIGDAELELWPDHRHRRQAPGLAVHAGEGRQVDVRDPIRIGGGEGPLPDVVLGGLEAAVHEADAVVRELRALEALGLSGEWSYGAVDLDPAEFDERVRALPGEGYVGVNVTIPHKESALRVADEASDAAHQIGAANTLSFRDDLIRADNTDATGLLATLPEPLEGRAALVLGAGGSARAAAWALAGKGASVSVWNRTATRGDELVRDLAGTGVGTVAEGRLAAISADRARTGSFELIVNCSAIGMEDEDPFEHLPVDPDRLGASVTVVDLVYAGSESRLVAEARFRGARTIDGLEILVRQGAESLRLWTGMDPPLDAMREAARRGSETDG